MTDLDPQPGPKSGEPSCVTQIFADGYEGVGLVDLVLRMNLVVHNVSATGEPDPTVVARLALPLAAFLRIHEGFSQIVRDLEAEGVIARNSQTDASSAR